MSWSKRPEQARLEARPWAGIMASMAGSKPLLLLDVDGVLNPFAADSCPEEYREHDLLATGRELRPSDPVSLERAAVRCVSMTTALPVGRRPRRWTCP